MCLLQAMMWKKRNAFVKLLMDLLYAPNVHTHIQLVFTKVGVGFTQSKARLWSCLNKSSIKRGCFDTNPSKERDL